MQWLLSQVKKPFDHLRTGKQVLLLSSRCIALRLRKFLDNSWIKFYCTATESRIAGLKVSPVTLIFSCVWMADSKSVTHQKLSASKQYYQESQPLYFSSGNFSRKIKRILLTFWNIRMTLVRLLNLLLFLLGFNLLFDGWFCW